jgi:mannose-1-phosphate guanylyltransferase
MTIKEHFYAAIMAGGGGTRLWPLSRRSRPKQSLAIIDKKTLFQIAVDRIRPLIPIDRIFVMTGEDQVELLKAQYPELEDRNFLIEPEPRGTAAAIGLAAIHIKALDPDGTMACLTADHFIKNESEFRETIFAALSGAHEGGLFTLGIQPTSPDPSYGYIHKGEISAEFSGHQVFKVEAFKEKPTQELAQKYLQSGEYYWNSGMFFWRADAILDEMGAQLPKLFSGLRSIQNNLGKQNYDNVVYNEWKTIESTTIDYGIMEGAKDVFVVPAAGLGWVDVGDWGRLFDILTADTGGVVASKMDIMLDSTSSMVVRATDTDPEKLVALLDVDDLVVIETPDVLLVCRRQSADRVKALVEKLKLSGMERYL